MIKLIPLILYALVICVYAESINVSGTELKIVDKKDLIATYSNGNSDIIDVKMPSTNDLRFVKHADTNVVHLERVTNKYVLLIESLDPDREKSISYYKAIVISRDGQIDLSDFYKSSKTFGAGRESMEFKSFAKEMNVFYSE